MYAIATFLHLITCALPGHVLQLLMPDPVGTSRNTVIWSPACWHRRGAWGKLLHRADSGCCIDCDRDVMSGNSCYVDMSIFFVRKLLACQLECDNFMLLCAQDFRIISIKDLFLQSHPTYWYIFAFWSGSELPWLIVMHFLFPNASLTLHWLKKFAILKASVYWLYIYIYMYIHVCVCVCIYIYILSVTWVRCQYGSECQFPCCFLRTLWCTRLWPHEPNCHLHVNWRWQ